MDLLVEGELLNNVVGNQHRNHQTVNGYDTRHDHRDDGLHDELRPHDRHGSNAGAALRCAISCTQGCEEERQTEVDRRLGCCRSACTTSTEIR